MPGDGQVVERHRFYRLRVRVWLSEGAPIRWQTPWGLIDRAVLEDEGTTLVTDARLDRNSLVSGLLYDSAL
ncbi:MAG: hypothetical protein LC804_03970 [Acidobacteria bacterium]|nr:hypothetical protein [Acidobacteriota bacterium]MCA1583571.1 hypothetical protein [Acidobacteriota bacterium]